MNVDPQLAPIVRQAAQRLAAARPGKAIELRVPPYVAVQLGSPDSQQTHRRGTPPAVIETDAATFMEMINGQLSWKAAVGGHRVAASGAHADLSDLFPEPAAQADGT